MTLSFNVTPAEKLAQRLLAENFLNRLRSKLLPLTNPKIISQALTNLGLDSFRTRDAEFSAFLNKIVREPVDMRAFLNKMQTDLLDHDAICMLLAYIEENNLVSEKELHSALPLFQLQINLLCILEAFTVTLTNSKTLVADAYQHVLRRRNCYLPGNTFATFLFGVPKEASLFERLKIISVDPAFLNIMFHREQELKTESKEEAQDFIKKYSLSSWNSASIIPLKMGEKSTDSIAGMGLNILEASWQDAKHDKSNILGEMDNAKAGMGLIGILEENEFNTCGVVHKCVVPEGTLVLDDKSYSLLPDLKIDTHGKKIQEFRISSEWRDLYNTWNSHFVITNLNSIILPLTILLPSLFAASPAMFREIRVLSLFLLGNSAVNEKINKNAMFTTKFEFVNSNKILAKWGEINKAYASHLLHVLCPQLDTTPDKLYTAVLGGRPSVNLIRNFCLFAKNGSNYRCTSQERKTAHIVPITTEALLAPNYKV